MQLFLPQDTCRQLTVYDIMSDYISIVYEYVTERKVKQCGYHEKFSGGKHTVLCWSIYLQYSYLL